MSGVYREEGMATKEKIEEKLRNRILFIGDKTDVAPAISHPDGIQIYTGCPNDLIAELAEAAREDSACQHECGNPGLHSTCTCAKCGALYPNREARGEDSGTPAVEELVIEIARELYDRFVMGGWEPQDAYPQIREWLKR